MFKQIKSEVKKKLLLPIKYVIALVTIILFLLVSGYIYYSHLSSSVDIKYQTSLKTIAHTQNDKINFWFNNWLGKLNTIAGDSSITHFISLQIDNPSYKILRENIETQLRSYVADNEISALEILNSDNQVVYAAGIKLGKNSAVIKCGLNNTNHLEKLTSCNFLLNKNKEVRLAVSYTLPSINNQAGSIYAEILTDAAFGSSLNNILINQNSDIDLYYRDGMNVISLQRCFYNNLHFEDDIKPEVILNISDLIGLNDSESLRSFKDKKSKEQFAYIVNNDRTGWIVTARDKNKENYSYLIEQLSSYLVAGLLIVIIIAVLILLLWKRTLMFYTTAVKSDYEIDNLQARFTHFSKFSNDFFFLLDVHGKIIEYNEKVFNNYGYSIEELKELNFRDLLIIKERTKTDEFFRVRAKSRNSLFNSTNGLIFDTVNIRKDKTEFQVEVSLRRVEIYGKEMIQAIVRDVSSRISSEKKIKESEEIFELIVNNLNEVVYIYSINPDRKFDYISPSIKKLTGYDQQEFYSDPMIMFKIIHSDERYKIKSLMEGDIDEYQSKIRFVTKDGNILWIQHRAVPRKNKNNEIISLVGILRDITGQVSSEIMMKKREDSFRYLFENNPLPMWLYDFRSKHFINVNEAAIAHYGYSRDEFLTLKLTDIVIADNTIETTENELLNTIESGETIEYLHTIKDGNIISVEVNSHLIQLNGSKNNAVLEVVQDITDRKKVEAKIQESEQRFKTLAKISPVAIFRTNSRGELTYMNENWTEMTGVFPEIAFGKKWWEGLPINDKPVVEKRWNRIAGTTGNFESEFQLSNTKSKVTWVLASIIRIKSQEDKIIGYVGTLTDITRLKMFEGNFRKLYYSVEQSPVSVIITDKKGNIEYVNPAVIKTSGYAKDELLGGNLNLLDSDYHDKSFYENLWETISDGNVWRGELYNRRKDGTFFWEQASIAPVYNETKEITNFVAVKEDITVKKKLEEELNKAKNDAIELSCIKTNFLAKINHELRTPLVGILGCSQTIYEEATNDHLKEMGRILIKESNRLNDSLKPILALSKIETELQDISVETLNVIPEIKKITNQFSKGAIEKGITLKFEEPETEIYIDVNRELFKDIIINVLGNGIKYTPAGSVNVFTEIQNDELVINVVDTGIGIPDEEKEIVFEPFRQANENFSSTKDGIGLGLTLAKKYTDLLGGKIWFTSKVGEGSTFYISFKTVKVISKPAEAKPVPVLPVEEISDRTTRRKLLIVEDDEINLRIATMYVEDLFEVTAATNSSEALDHVAKEKFDVILMDIGLRNGLDGKELTKILRKMNDYKNIPIIALTAFTMESDKELIFSAGCSHYLSKPYSKQDLRDIMIVALQ